MLIREKRALAHLELPRLQEMSRVKPRCKYQKQHGQEDVIDQTDEEKHVFGKFKLSWLPFDVQFHDCGGSHAAAFRRSLQLRIDFLRVCIE